MSGAGAVLRAARVRFKPRAAAVFGAGYTIVIYYRFVGYLELPSSEDENYKANTRKGVDVEYIPTEKSA